MKFIADYQYQQYIIDQHEGLIKKYLNTTEKLIKDINIQKEKKTYDLDFGESLSSYEKKRININFKKIKAKNKQSKFIQLLYQYNQIKTFSKDYDYMNDLERSQNQEQCDSQESTLNQ